MLTFSTFLNIIIMNLYVGVVYMKELNYKKIGERLRKLRKYMGLTQEQVAEILSVGRDAILRIEKGERKIDLQELISFSKLYNISMDELTTEEHTINSSDVAFARGFNELSEKDKKEIISLIEYKNILKSQNKDD
jgi:transcriptional regulator with XRE-family HTH domain